MFENKNTEKTFKLSLYKVFFIKLGLHMLVLLRLLVKKYSTKFEINNELHMLVSILIKNVKWYKS